MLQLIANALLSASSIHCKRFRRRCMFASYQWANFSLVFSSRLRLTFKETANTIFISDRSLLCSLNFCRFAYSAFPSNIAAENK